MSKKTMAILVLLLLAIAALATVNGCALIGGGVKSDEQAAQKAIDASATMDELSGTLEEIDKDLG